MRLDLRLHGVTESGVKCRADVSVYAGSQRDLFKQADIAAKTAAWLTVDAPISHIPEGSQITIEHVERIWKAKGRL
jgi:hypothetical protein